jgi:hypothetical protein
MNSRVSVVSALRHGFVGIGLLTSVTAVASVGCSSNDSSSSQNAGASETTTTADAGTTGTTGNTGDAASNPPECQTITDQAESQISQAYYASQPSNSCSTDDDCVLFPNESDCTSSCGMVTNKAGAAAAQAAVDAANAGTCKTFVADGCVKEALPCASVGMAACLNNYCQSGFRAAWTSFSMESDTGGTGSSLPVACTGTSCTLWTVTPDGNIQTTTTTGTKTARMASADFTAVDTLLKSSQFRQEVTSGVLCGTVTKGTTQHVSESVTRDTAEMGTDVTGCITAGPAGNDYLALYNLVKGY